MPATMLFTAAGCVGIACGIALGLSTPTTMKPTRPSELPSQVAAINPSAPYPGYATVPEDVSAHLARASSAQYRDYVVDETATTYPEGIVTDLPAPERRAEPQIPRPNVPAGAEVSIAALRDLNARWPGTAAQNAEANPNPSVPDDTVPVATQINDQPAPPR